MPADSNSAAPVATTLKLENPVENYYRHKMKTNLPVFYRFALQTRSLMIRDVFAKAASKRGYDLTDLLAVLTTQTSADLDDESKASIAEVFDSEVLLTLANLLANTARDELDTHSALQIYDFVYRICGGTVFQDAHKLQYVEALGAADRHTDVRHFAREFEINSLAPLQEELLEIQRIKQEFSSDEDWLDALNELYGSLGMTKVLFSDDTLLPLMDRLMAVPAEKIQGPRVSVIMPTFSPGPGIKTAVRSLLEQTWENIEIIVVDDASPPEFRKIYAEVGQMDPRIRVVHHDDNMGPYVARNSGLAIASGEFVTTHDDDDWSHPDKLATQVQSLLDHESAVAVTSTHIRTSESMEFQRVNILAKYMQMNYSSLMFRKTLVEAIGPWDTVNRGGDSEFLTRLIEYAGSENVLHLSDRPFSFSRVWSGSLTSGEMSRGFFAYSRLLYRWAFRQWHWQQGKLGKSPVLRPQESRPYAIPTTFESGTHTKNLGSFDVIYVTDFFRQAKYVDYVVQEIETLSEKGLRIGYTHMYSPETDRPAGISPRLLSLQLEGKISQVSYDDVADTKVLIVYDPSIGMFLDEIKSTIRSQRSILIDRGLPVLVNSPERNSVFMSQALRHLDDCFDTEFEVVGASNDDQEGLLTRVPHSRVLPDEMIWRPHVRQKQGDIRAPETTPIIGFHSYGNQYRWPNNLKQFEAIYNSPEYETRFFGSLESAIQKFGAAAFAFSEVVSTAESNELEFLSSIDFWVYGPHSKLADQIWEPVLSAMWAGKVVILPPRFAAHYGTAAVYAHSYEVEDIVKRFSEHTEDYLAQAQRGRSFIQAAYTDEHLVSRVRDLLS